ncbi:Acyl-CoA synthetase (AMP-forming)/AMP-acid ligase II [Asanoa hainanensis]|uniref:Acyl-CoA synthetase (AMP-forming)/AMP-acid ligase II n=1 Tax=Asanoa hainanensis TaxID=560556 RepID=A0A239MRM3_9ACTN|nr:AMP-binding protein [Asanoa hainanensis]SNT45315.1 Acyl-CoA synthetase (AMP-forming)/AMP-acid ligase II [Asanoa hainanensis]
MTAAHAVLTLARRGLLNPGSPLRVARQISVLRHWGYGLGGSLLSAAARSPSRVALIDSSGSLSYAALSSSALAMAGALRSSQGMGPGDRVGVLFDNGRDFVVSVAALSLLGADAVLINTGFSPTQVAAVVRDHGLRLVLDAPSLPLLPLPLSLPLLPPGRPGRTVVLTSGTTGTPKGARRPHPGGPGPLAAILDRIPVRAGSRMFIAAPLFHTWGYASLQLAIGLRATVVLSPRFSPASAASLVRSHGCSSVFAVPVMLSRLLEAGCALPGVRVVAVSGSALPGDLATRFMSVHGKVLYNLYGSTEVSWASVATPAELLRSPGTAGRPPRGTRLMVLSPSGSPVPPGIVGRIFVGNSMLFEGYTGGDLPAPAAVDGLLATGDLGRLDDSGLLTVVGRADDMVISGGENVFPSAVEDLLARLDGVREAAVVGVPDPEFGERLAAFVVRSPGATLSANDVRDHVRRLGARFAVPRDVHFVPSLPRTTTGKIIKRSLGELDR